MQGNPGVDDKISGAYTHTYTGYFKSPVTNKGKKNAKIWKKGSNFYFRYNITINAQYGRPFYKV